MVTGKIPHLRVVVAVSAAAIIGFAIISGYVLGYTDDDVTKGGIVATWQNVALLAFGFWLGSSSGGKGKDDAPSGKPEDPVSVTETHLEEQR
ncbi:MULTISPECIES: hypothetical protein [Alphaproteobacteria]|uniref:hypothetical protein n=1 Tax=Sphingopyxis sp. TaxID=1908224 RepID=UPI004033D7D3